MADPWASFEEVTPSQSPKGDDDKWSMFEPVKNDQASNQSSDEPSTVADIVRSIPGGLAKGAASLAGLPGNIEQGINYGLSKLGQLATGRTEEERLAHEEEIKKGRVLPTLPTSGDVEKAISAPFGGLYEPKTIPGQYAETTASMAPAALGAPNAASAIARVVAPGVASEAAGQATKGSEYEPLARTAGAVLGGGLEGFGEGYLKELAQSAGIPSTSELKNNAGYKVFASQPVTVTPEATSVLHDRYGTTAIRRALSEAQINRETDIVSELHGLLDKDPALRPSQIRTDTADKIRQAFDSLADGASTPNAARGWSDRADAMETAVQQTPEINAARNIWSQFRKSEIIDKAIQKAKDAEGTPAGFGDPAQALRREFLKLTRNQKFSTFSPDEQEALKAVANGTFSSNTLQQLGKLSPVRGLISRLAELGGLFTGHAPEAVGMALGGELARQGSNLATARAARLASETVRNGSKVIPQLGKNVGRGITAGTIFSDPFNQYGN